MPCVSADGIILLEQNDEWAVQRARYMTLETIGALSDDPIVKLPAVAAGQTSRRARHHRRSYTTPGGTIDGSDPSASR